MPLSRGVLKLRFNQDQGTGSVVQLMLSYSMYVVSKSFIERNHQWIQASSVYAHTGCFACALESGVQIYNVDPLAEKGRIGKCSMLVVNLHEPLLRVEVTPNIHHSHSCDSIERLQVTSRP